MAFPVTKFRSDKGDILEYLFTFTKPETISIELQQIIGGVLSTAKGVTIYSDGFASVIYQGKTLAIPNGFEYDLTFLNVHALNISGQTGTKITLRVYTGDWLDTRQFYNKVQNLVNTDPTIPVVYTFILDKIASVFVFGAGSDSIFPIGQPIQTPVRLRTPNATRKTFALSSSYPFGFFYGHVPGFITLPITFAAQNSASPFLVSEALITNVAGPSGIPLCSEFWIQCGIPVTATTPTLYTATLSLY